MAGRDHAATNEKKGTKATHITMYDLFILLLAIISLILLPLLLFMPLSESVQTIFLACNFIISIFFFIDFLRNLYLASNKWKYFITWGWLDLLGSIPITVFTLARIARLILILRILHRTSRRSLITSLLEQRVEGTLYFTGIFTLLLIVLSSIGILQIESQAPGANILNASDALWWAMQTITTVGYGDEYPVTNPGRLIGVLVMTVGVGIFGVFTSYLSTTFLTFKRRAQDNALKLIHRDIADLKEELAEIKQLLQKHEAPGKDPAEEGNNSG
jgi:voltage-gated potassium channel